MIGYKIRDYVDYEKTKYSDAYDNMFDDVGRCIALYFKFKNRKSEELRLFF